MGKHTDPLWLGGVSEAPSRPGGCRRGAGGERGSSGASWRSWRGAWILTAVKIPSLAASHTLNHKDMCSSHTPPPHGLTACNAAGLTLLLQHVCAHMQAQPMHYVKRIIYPEHVITDHWYRERKRDDQRKFHSIFSDSQMNMTGLFQMKPVVLIFKVN